MGSFQDSCLQLAPGSDFKMRLLLSLGLQHGPKSVLFIYCNPAVGPGCYTSRPKVDLMYILGAPWQAKHLPTNPREACLPESRDTSASARKPETNLEDEMILKMWFIYHTGIHGIWCMVWLQFGSSYTILGLIGYGVWLQVYASFGP